MSGIIVDGKEKLATGGYSEFSVQSDTLASPPEFNIGILVGTQEQGIGYYANNGVTDPLLKVREWNEASQVNDVENKYGKGSELAEAFRQSKKHGLSGCYLIGLSETTKTVVPIKDVTPATCITLTHRHAGAYTADFHIAIVNTAGTVVVTTVPPKQPAFLTADALTGATQCKVKVLPSWLKVDATVKIIDDDSIEQALIVTAIETNKTTVSIGGQTADIITDYTVKFTGSALSADYSKAKSGRIFVLDTISEVVPAYTSNDDIVAWFNANSKYWTAVKNTALVPVTKTDTRAGEFAGATVGTTPVPTTTSITNLITALPELSQRFKLAEGVSPRLFCIIWGLHADQLNLRDYAYTRRANGEPIQIIVGGSKGAIDLTSGTPELNPKTRAAALNSEDVIPCWGGWDGMGAYLTFSPAVFGTMIFNKLAHNLTDDELNFAVPEVVWNKDDGTMDKILRAGGVVYDIQGGYHIEKGQNSLQEQAFWNPTTKRTYLIMQRNCADYVIKNFPEDVRKRLGGTTDVEVTKTDASVIGNLVLASYVTRGVIISGKVVNVDVDPNKEGWIISVEFSLPQERNYVLCRLTLKV